MKTKHIAVAALLAALGHAAHAEVVERFYSARITSMSPGLSFNPKFFHIGDQLLGSFAYDAALIGAPTKPGTIPSHEYAYKGIVQNNYITTALGGETIVPKPSSQEPSCSALDPFCRSLPIVVSRDNGPNIQGKETDVLTLSYSTPLDSTWELGEDDYVSYVQMKFFYAGQLAGSNLPTQISLADLDHAELRLSLRRSGDLTARVDMISMSAVPEPSTSMLMALGGLWLAAVTRLARAKRPGRVIVN